MPASRSQRSTVDVDVNGNGFFSTSEGDLDDATFLKFSLTLKSSSSDCPVRTPTTRTSAASASAPRPASSPSALIKANPTKIAGDNRTFMAVDAMLASVGLVGLADLGIQIQATSLFVEAQHGVRNARRAHRARSTG